MKKLLIIIMAIAAFGAYAATDLTNLWGQVANKVGTTWLFSEKEGDITNAVESLIGDLTTGELLAMLRDQYKRDLLTKSPVKMKKWHGESTVSIDTNECSKTYTFADGFKFKVDASPRERTQVDRNAMAKIMAKNKDPRINQANAKISNLKKMLSDSKSYSLPTAAIEAALANEQAFLDKLTGKAEVVIVTTEINKKDWRIRSTKLNIAKLEEALSKSENYSDEKIAEIENALANEKEYLSSLIINSGKAHYDVDPDNVHTLKVEE